MANFPKKANDPTEAALSAIQEALNVRASEESSEPLPPDDNRLDQEPLDRASLDPERLDPERHA